MKSEASLCRQILEVFCRRLRLFGNDASAKPVLIKVEKMLRSGNFPHEKGKTLALVAELREEAVGISSKSASLTQYLGSD